VGATYWFNSNTQNISYSDPNKSAAEQEADLEFADFEQEDWPITDEIVGTLGHVYAQRVGMTDEAYSKITGVKCGVKLVQKVGFETIMSETAVVEKAQVYKALDELMITDFQRINRTFREMDDNGDGTLQPEEFRNALKVHGMKMSDKNFNDLWSDFDNDGDGNITYKEVSERSERASLVTESVRNRRVRSD